MQPQQIHLRILQILLLHRLKTILHPSPLHHRRRKQPKQPRQTLRILPQRLPTQLKRRRHTQLRRHLWISLNQSLSR